MKHSLRDTYVYRFIGERIFDRRIWRTDMNSVAGGVSLGLFVGFTPTIPFQMLLSALGAILLRVNLPVSLVVCWVTNPLTSLPIYLAAHRLGKYLLGHSQLFEVVFEFFDLEGRRGGFMVQSVYLWTGSLIFSVVSASFGYVALRFAWSLKRWLKGKTSGDNENA